MYGIVKHKICIFYSIFRFTFIYIMLLSGRPGWLRPSSPCPQNRNRNRSIDDRQARTTCWLLRDQRSSQLTGLPVAMTVPAWPNNRNSRTSKQKRQNGMKVEDEKPLQEYVIRIQIESHKDFRAIRWFHFVYYQPACLPPGPQFISSSGCSVAVTSSPPFVAALWPATNRIIYFRSDNTTNAPQISRGINLIFFYKNNTPSIQHNIHQFGRSRGGELTPCGHNYGEKEGCGRRMPRCRKQSVKILNKLPEWLIRARSPRGQTETHIKAHSEAMFSCHLLLWHPSALPDRLPTSPSSANCNGNPHRGQAVDQSTKCGGLYRMNMEEFPLVSH